MLPTRPRRSNGRGRPPTYRSGLADGNDCSSTTAGWCPETRRSSAGATRPSFSNTSIRRSWPVAGIVSSFNSQGIGIIAASLITFGTPEQQREWAIPILRAEMTAALGMSEPGAGSDLASLRTRAERDGDDFVVNGQKVWTSGAHDADVILTFVRTDVDAPKHQGISVLLIPTDSPGLIRRPFASAADRDELDFNEVFFTDVRVPAKNLVGTLNDGWAVASGSLGHERNMLWLSYADRLQDLIDDWRPSTVVEKDQFATLVMDNYALRLLGSAALARAAHGSEDVSALSVLKLFGAETVQTATEHALDSVWRRWARASRHDRAVHPVESRPLRRQLGRPLFPLVRGDHRRRHVGDPAKHHRPARARFAAPLTRTRVDGATRGERGGAPSRGPADPRPPSW